MAAHERSTAAMSSSQPTNRTSSPWSVHRRPLIGRDLRSTSIRTGLKSRRFVRTSASLTVAPLATGATPYRSL